MIAIDIGGGAAMARSAEQLAAELGVGVAEAVEVLRGRGAQPYPSPVGPTLYAQAPDEVRAQRVLRRERVRAAVVAAIEAGHVTAEAIIRELAAHHGVAPAEVRRALRSLVASGRVLPVDGEYEVDTPARRERRPAWQVQEVKTMRDLVRALAAAKRPMTTQELARTLGLSEHTVRGLLNTAPQLFERAGRDGRRVLWRLRDSIAADVISREPPVAGPRFGRPGPGTWRTPPEFFDAVQRYLGVRCTVDAAADETTALVSRYWSYAGDANAQPGDVIWCNPPWSRLQPWAEWFVDWARRGASVVALLPAATDTQWFARLWTSGYLRRLLLITPRVAFHRADGMPSRAPTIGVMVAYLEPGRSTIPPRVELVRWDGRDLRPLTPEMIDAQETEVVRVGADGEVVRRGMVG